MRQVDGSRSRWKRVSSVNLGCGRIDTLNYEVIFVWITFIMYFKPVLFVCTSASLISISAFGDPPLIWSLWVI